ncbi:MAG: hypothetical protein AAGF33_10450, partial [Pseudomonadota bacterium]
RPKDMFARAEKAAADQIRTETDAIEGWKKADGESDADFAKRKRAAPDEIRRRIWSELAGGYRVAKKAMEAQGDFDREQIYYRFEVKARMRRPDISPTERLVSFFYNNASNYGASIGRPLLTFLFFLTVFASAYYALGVRLLVIGALHDTLPPSEGWVKAFELSWNAAFRGLFILPINEPDTVKSFTDKLFFPGRGWWGLITRALVTTQALLSLLLLFLFALAVRRKFQIS